LTAAAWKARSAAKGGKGVFGSAMAWEVSRRHDFLSSHESYSAASSPPRSAACWGMQTGCRAARITSTPLALGHFAVPTPGGGPRVAVVCALAFVLMIPWEISRRNPAIDLRMIATHQFAACFW